VFVCACVCGGVCVRARAQTCASDSPDGLSRRHRGIRSPANSLRNARAPSTVHVMMGTRPVCFEGGDARLGFRDEGFGVWVPGSGLGVLLCLRGLMRD